jgi:hypothetical protein
MKGRKNYTHTASAVKARVPFMSATRTILEKIRIRMKDRETLKNLKNRKMR